MTKKCSGCGSILQSEDKNALGYQPKTKKSNADLCERCFKIIHYNDAKIVTLPIDQNKILSIINKDKSFCFFLIDFLNINQSTLDVYKKIKNYKALIISKCDIIPYSIKKNKIEKWLKEVYNIQEDIFFISSLKNKNVNMLINYLTDHNIKKAYLTGFTNAGKSSLLNSIINTSSLNYHSITTSLVPNTTLDFMNVKISDNLTLIDSPGFTLKNTIYQNNDINFLKKINPKKYLKPITYQLKENASIIIENKIRIENLSEKNSFTFYLSEALDLKRIFESEKLTNLSTNVYDVETNSDLVIKELGFINIKKKCKIKIYIENQNLIEIRKSMFN